MKKNDFILLAMFLVIVLFLFVIPVSALLTADIPGLGADKSIGQWIYMFLKDQGGLIGSVFGTLVLAITVYLTLKKQSENTQKQIDFEIKKNRVNTSVQEMEKSIVVLDRIKSTISRVYALYANQKDEVAVFIFESEVANDIMLVSLLAETVEMCEVNKIERVHSNISLYFVILRIIEMERKQLPFSFVFEALFKLSTVERRDVFNGDSEMALAELVNSIKDFIKYAGDDHPFDNAECRQKVLKEKLNLVYDKLPDAIICLKNDIVRNIDYLSRDVYIKKNNLLNELN